MGRKETPTEATEENNKAEKRNKKREKKKTNNQELESILIYLNYYVYPRNFPVNKITQRLSPDQPLKRTQKTLRLIN